MSDEAPKEGVVNNYHTHTVEKHPFVIDWEEMTKIIACLSVVAIVGSIAWGVTSYNLDANAKMEAAIKAGSNPIDAYCAFDGSSENKVCLLRAAQKDEK
jgi:DMSO reductase anchor subunit